MWVQSLSQKDPLEDDMATYSNILVWKTPWTEEPGKLQSTGQQRVEQDQVHARAHVRTHTHSNKSKKTRISDSFMKLSCDPTFS